MNKCGICTKLFSNLRLSIIGTVRGAMNASLLRSDLREGFLIALVRGRRGVYCVFVFKFSYVDKELITPRLYLPRSEFFVRNPNWFPVSNQ
jgi:hypothetical protein